MPAYQCPDCGEVACICPCDVCGKPGCTGDGVRPCNPSSKIIPDRWYRVEDQLPEAKKRVEVYSEDYAKSGSFSPFQFGKWMGWNSGCWVVEGSKQSHVNVTHWRKPSKPV